MENLAPALSLVKVTAVTLAVSAPGSMRVGLFTLTSASENVGVALKAGLVAVDPVKTEPPGTVQVPPSAHDCPLTVVAAPDAALPFNCVCTDDVGSRQAIVAGVTPSTVLLVSVWVSVVFTIVPLPSLFGYSAPV